MGTSSQIIEQYGSGERLEIEGSEKLAEYIKANTELKVEYYKDKDIISITLDKKIDALAALAVAEESKMDWDTIQTRRDSLEDVFIKLVSGEVNEQGEIMNQQNDKKDNQRRK